MASHGARPNYVAVWRWLVVLMGVGLAASFLPGGRALAATLIFATAAVKATLVALNYMHLKFEPRLIYAIAIVPVLFVLGLMVALFPDFVFHR
ncbi:MAG: cytochrome C oxidase subunit IV family protein [Candidatus Rokubacteria bacterium]|nr:cytochrome C oxidase subunit IV family protein [Candidatus Rokubacteria bacterium]